MKSLPPDVDVSQASVPGGQSAEMLAEHQSGIVCGFVDDCVAHKYMCMGVRLGSKIELVRRAPFGRACYFKIDGRVMAVRREEAACLMIQRLAESL